MEGLLAEINAKKRQIRDGADEAESSSKKYKTRGEIEAEKEEEERQKRAVETDRRERLKAESRARRMRKEAEQARKNASARLASPSTTPAEGASTELEAFNVSPEECIRRLRLLRQPIRLFGETDKDRKLRLRALELLDERGEGQQNDFKRTLESLESETEEKKLAELARALQSGKTTDKEAKKELEILEAIGGVTAAADKGTSATGTIPPGQEAGAVLDLKLIRDDPNKLYPLIYYALKNVLKEWEEWMDARPEDVKRSGQGKMAAATQASSAQNLKPLFKQLRTREMAPDVLRGLAEIVHYMQTRSYQRANDSYLRLSIGTAAWPIGVTSVGIHERSSQDKLYVDKIAHVLNDEVSRKWIQAVKRLLTFSQGVRPPKEISQMMG